MSQVWLTRDEVRELDRRAIEEFHMPSIVLMENAGRGCAELLMKLNPEQQPVVILCGPGNNGGDGFVVARHLDINHWPVTVWLIRPESNRTFGFARAVAATDRRLAPDCETNAAIWAEYQRIFTNDIPGNQWKEAAVADIERAGWIVDALFGTGLTRPLEAPYHEIIPFINSKKKPVFSIDVPTGLACDTGLPLGPTIEATHTATFVAHKKGFLDPESRTWTGDVHVIDIGVPRVLKDEYQHKRGA